MLPNFLHIGLPKAASGWLWRALKEHPEVYAPEKPDNVNFFTVHWQRGLDWYEQTYFADVRGEKAVGEFSNSYVMVEAAQRRIAEHLPGVRLSVTLRDPLERAFLQWAHIHLKRKRYGLDARKGVGIPFERCLDHHGHQWWRMWIEPGLYALHLERVFRLFPKERVHVALYDDLCEDPLAFYRGFLEFLEVDAGFRPSWIGQDVNPDAEDASLEQWVSAEARAEFRAGYREDVEKLQEMIGRDLGHWLRERPGNVGKA